MQYIPCTHLYKPPDLIIYSCPAVLHFHLLRQGITVNVQKIIRFITLLLGACILLRSALEIAVSHEMDTVIGTVLIPCGVVLVLPKPWMIRALAHAALLRWIIIPSQILSLFYGSYLVHESVDSIEGMFILIPTIVSVYITWWTYTRHHKQKKVAHA